MGLFEQSILTCKQYLQPVKKVTKKLKQLVESSLEQSKGNASPISNIKSSILIPTLDSENSPKTSPSAKYQEVLIQNQVSILR